MISLTYQVKWILYNILVAFAFYWLSNVILWYPWSYSTVLGMTLMLTLNPLIWGFAIFTCLVRYQGQKAMVSAIICASVMVIVSAIADFIFFGLIRDALDELYHPTTFYGYLFLLILPFAVLLVLRKQVEMNKKQLVQGDFVRVGTLGLVCLILIMVIVMLDLRIAL